VPWRAVALAAIFTLFALLRKASIATVLLIAILLGSSLMSLRQGALSSSEIASNIGKSVEITARITTDPREVEKKVSGRNFLPPSYSFLAKSRVPIRIITTDLSVANLLPGQEIH